MKIHVRPLLWAFFVCLFLIAAKEAGAASLASYERISDDSALRLALADMIQSQKPDTLLLIQPSLQNIPGGEKVQVRTEDGGAEVLLIIARELKDAAGAKLYGFYPGWVQGSWVIAVNKESGLVSRLRLFLKNDPNIYLQFSPFDDGSEKSYCSIVVYNAILCQNSIIPLAFSTILTNPLDKTLKIAGQTCPLKYFDTDNLINTDTINFIKTVQEQIKDFTFVDDGAMNEKGQFVYIETGDLQKISESPGGFNCSGFTKWLIDGMLEPVSGELLAIPPLKAPVGGRGNNFTQKYESLDPFFGLDWTRNLAIMANSTLRSPSFATLEEFEVRTVPFDRIIDRKNANAVVNYPNYLDNAGWTMPGLEALLFTLAVNQPGRLYLAAVNNVQYAKTTADNPRGLPHLRTYFHVAALIPYFNEYGNFQVAIFESAAETSIKDFVGRYSPDTCVNLCAVPIVLPFAGP
ncbi:MAG: hypothetical protein LBM77_13805 [Spirochaetaceae bacterium]|jgi:hypothetical protein|nr:hypothetical protein [Spirochaetaceae bacterium]